MSFTEGLRAFVSVQGVPQKRLQASLQGILMNALEQNPPAKQEAANIAKREADVTVNDAGNRQNVFVTSASLATFPVASGVITVIWKLLKVIGPTTSALKSPIIPLILALLLGAFFAYMGLTDPERTKPPTSRDIIVNIVIALINSLFLAAAVLGIDTIALQ